MENDGSSLRRFQRLTSVAFGATSFQRKEAIFMRLRRRWNPDDTDPITWK